MANLKREKASETKLQYIISLEYDIFLRFFSAWADRHAVSQETQKKITKNLKPFLRQNCANLRTMQLKRAILYVCNASGAELAEVCELFNMAIRIKIIPAEKN